MKKIISIALAALAVLSACMGAASAAVYDPPQELALYIGGTTPNATVSVGESGEYTLSYEGEPISNWSWILIKGSDSEGFNAAPTAFAAGTVIRVTSVRINGSDVPFKDSAEYYDYIVPDTTNTEIKLYFDAFGPDDTTALGSEKPLGGADITSVEVGFTVGFEYAASFDGTPYESLSDALSAASAQGSGDILMLDDCTVSGFSLPAGVRLDMKGYTLECTGDINLSGDMTVNGTLDLSGGKVIVSNGAHFVVTDGAELNGDISFDVTAENFDNYFANTVVTINGGTINGSLPAIEDVRALGVKSYDSPITFGLYMDTQGGTAALATVEVPRPGEYALSYENADGISADWVMIKSTDPADTANALVTVPIDMGSVAVRTEKFTLDGVEQPFPSGSYHDYYPDSEGRVELAYYFDIGYDIGMTPVWTGKPNGGTVHSCEIVFTIDPENYRSDVELDALIKSAIRVSVLTGKNAEDYYAEPSEEPQSQNHRHRMDHGCVYLDGKHHAAIIDGRFLAYPHVDGGHGHCPICHGMITE